MDAALNEIGTLIVVVLKAKNLPNKRHIGKQDPYCSVKHNGEQRRTKAIKRGGQHPEWDEEVRFTIFGEPEEETPPNLTNGSEGAPPPPPPKEDKKKDRKIKGGMKMRVSCFADDPREPDLIGEANVDLMEVLTKGETDEWFTLMNKEKYCGEVYLELTFWSNEKPPEKKPVPQASTFHPQYGGPGSFTPSGDVPTAPQHGGSTPSPSRISPNSTGVLPVPSALRPSSSLASIPLYKPPYERHSRYSDVDHLANSISDLSVNDAAKRSDSLPPNPSSMAEFGYTGPPDGTYSTLSSLNSTSSIHSVHSMGRLPSHHRNSLSSLPGTSEEGYSPSHLSQNHTPYPGQMSTDFLHHPGVPHTPMPYSYNHSQTASVLAEPDRSGRPHHRYSLPNPNESYIVPDLDTMPAYPLTEPVPSSELGTYSNSTFTSHGFVQPPPLSHTPVPSHYNTTSPVPPTLSSGFVPPQPSASAMAFHSLQSPPQQYPPPISHTPAPSMSYSQPTTSYPPHEGSLSAASMAPVSHSASPSQTYPHTPSPPHQGVVFPPPAVSSRPLPVPGHPPQPPVMSSYSPAPASSVGAPAFPSAMPFQPPGPPPPPPPRRNPSLPPTPTKTSYPPPPPPSLPNGSPLSQISSPHSQPPSQFQTSVPLPPPPPPPPPPFPPSYTSNLGQAVPPPPPPSHTPSPGHGYGSHIPNQLSNYIAPPPPPPVGQSTFSPDHGSPSAFQQQNQDYFYSIPPTHGQHYYNTGPSFSSPPPPPPPQQAQPWNVQPPPPPPSQMPHYSGYDNWR